MREVNTWAKAHSATLRTRLEEHLQDNTNYLKWLRWSIAYAWAEHSRRLHGIINEELFPSLEAVLGWSRRELIQVCDHGRDQIALRGYADRARRGELDESGGFQMLRNA